MKLTKSVASVVTGHCVHAGRKRAFYAVREGHVFFRQVVKVGSETYYWAPFGECSCFTL